MQQDSNLIAVTLCGFASNTSGMIHAHSCKTAYAYTNWHKHVSKADSGVYDWPNK
jgi:hypothetical protein